ncbi:MAG: BlaI/MecI/CopY family transcriptional regulator [Bacteroidaceae bacterium]|nr:BlaI/MecI/CopY family transcriptional regulator [Bacteroidaceae bacterium]
MKRDETNLTRVEFQVMNIIWDLGGSVCAWDILERCPEPKPAYTTVATYLKVLYEKGYLTYRKEKGQGKTHRYAPLVTKAEYTRRTMQSVKRDFFSGSLKSMLSYFVREENLSEEEVKELIEMVSPVPNSSREGGEAPEATR